MAISVSVPKEITEYKSKVFFGMSGRQIGFLFLSAVLGIGVWALFYKVLALSIETTGYIVIAAVLPFVGLGFIQPHDMPLEKYLALLFRHYLGKNLLPYQTDLLLDAFRVQKQITMDERSESPHGTIGKSVRQGGCAKWPEIAQSVSGRAQNGFRSRHHRKEKIQSAKQKIKGARREIRTLRKQLKKENAQSCT